MDYSLSSLAGSAMPSPGFWRGRRVLLTGHTGFKGSWLACWLRELEADVLGVALADPPTVPSLWDQLVLDRVIDVRADITSEAWVSAAKDFDPEVVLHLAAQSLVSVGYKEPARTFHTNVLGTVQVMNVVADLKQVMATLVITTDKVYDPRQQPPHSEAHHLGGNDPYSASKAGVEMVVRAWPQTVTPRATARAGNVIGGGDWASDRLLPDLVRAWQRATPALLRRPGAIRPWQHVLEPLRGYLVYVERLASGREVSSALNFGPARGSSAPVAELVGFASEEWLRLGGPVPKDGWTESARTRFHETLDLTLDSRLASDELGWAGALDWKSAVTLTLEWYHGLQAGQAARDLTVGQLKAYSAVVEGLSHG